MFYSSSEKGEQLAAAQGELLHTAGTGRAGTAQPGCKPARMQVGEWDGNRSSP